MRRLIFRGFISRFVILFTAFLPAAFGKVNDFEGLTTPLKYGRSRSLFREI